MSDQFDPPAKTIGIDLHHFLNTLVLVRPIEVRHQVKTKFGLTDATAVDIHVLDGPGAGYCVRNTLIFPLLLQAALAPGVGTGRFTLGRIGQQENQKGDDPVWILSEANEADAVLARQYMASELYHRNAGISINSPGTGSPNPQPASAAPWGGQPVAAPPAPAQPSAPPPWGGQPVAPPAPQPPSPAPWAGGPTPAPQPLPQQPPWGGAPSDDGPPPF